jgi:hypothetical protein
MTTGPSESEIKAILEGIPKRRRTFLFFPRALTPQERLEEITVAMAEDALARGDTARFDSLTAKLGEYQPTRNEDRLDRVRIFATILMMAALFTIVVVVVNKKSPPTTLFQFVSLASGLAGIGLGWLFGTATTRSRK